jgi:hypothetical protein
VLIPNHRSRQTQGLDEDEARWNMAVDIKMDRAKSRGIISNRWVIVSRSRLSEADTSWIRSSDHGWILGLDR